MLGTLLAVGAVLLATAALALAIHARRLSQRAERRIESERSLAAPPVEPPAPPPGAQAADRALELVETLRRRMDLLEARDRNVARPVDPSLAAPPPVVPVVRVREHLQSLGYEDVEVVPIDAAGRTFGVEARRSGATSKGRAAVDEHGRVTARLAPSLRAFP